VLNSEAVSWHTFARRLALAAGLNARKVVAASATGLGWRAARPAYVPLEATRGARLPSLESAIARFVAESGPWREATEAGDQDRERAAA